MRILNFLFSIGILCSVVSISTSNLDFLSHSDTCSHTSHLDDLSPNNHFCGFDDLQVQLSKGERQLQEKLEQDLYQLIQKGYPATNGKALYTIPVVVHVVHNNGTGNIPTTQVTNAIQHLNDAFANLGVFNPATGVDVEIQFCLAQQDPSGNATNGITNTIDPLANMAMSQDAQLKSLIRWNPLNYINIYVVNSINGGVAGYAYLPSSHGNTVDGIVLEANYMGSSTDNSKVLVHEMGHYLGLYHTFQGSCTNNDCLVDGDKVCDTPPDGTTAWVPCSATTNSCSTDENDSSPNNPFRSIANGGLGDQLDQKENYMDYSRFECYDRFTQGQKTRMHFFLTGIRSSLLNSNACLSPCPNPINPSFTASATSISVGTAVNFTNTSVGATNYEWFVNNTSFATSLNSSYTFNAAGNYTILLEANNGDPNCIAFDSINISVTCPVTGAFTMSNNNPTLGSIVNFTSTTTNATVYNWTINNNTVSNLANFSYTFSAQGTYTICLTASNSLCSSTSCETYLVFLDTVDCGNQFLLRMGAPGIDEAGLVLTPAQNGTLYLAGNKGDSSFIMNVDPNGNLLWQYNFDLHSQREQMAALIEDSDGNLVGSCHGGNSPPFFKGFAFKFDPITKSFIWIQEFNLARVYDLIEKSSGGNYLISTHDQSAPSPGLFDDAGLLELNRTTGVPTNSINKSYSHGSSENFAKLEEINNEIYACGRFTQGASFGAFRGSLAKFDATGNPLLAKMNLYPLNQSARIYTFDMLVDNDSILMTYFGDNAGTQFSTNKFYLSKSDINGNINWAKEYTIPSFSAIVIYDIEKMGTGYLIYGIQRQAPHETFLVRVDAQGNPLWQNSYSSHSQTSNPSVNTLFVSGTSIYFVGTASNGSDDDLLLAKLNETGQIAGGCPEITALNINVSAIVNPTDTDINLVVYPNPFTPTSLVATSNIDYPTQQFLCESPCIEICDNGIDDDGDGLIDCEDPDCNCYYCEGKSSNHWYFGGQAAIEFSSGVPTALTNSPMNASEGNATISDNAGNLLFYTNGNTVWDASHNVMQNGTGLAGSSISAQSAMILKLPQNDSLYTIFTIPNWTDPAANLNLSVSYVNMKANGGLGAVTIKNTIIHTGVAEQVSACYHSNCQDIWILTHERLSDNYVAYLFTPAGVLSTPIISSVGSVTTGGNRYGGLRFSHDGKKLCSTLGGSGTLATVELFDFDQATGVVSNPVILADNNAFSGAYSSEFSINNQVLYVTAFNGSTIRQYDLSLPAVAIPGSMINIATGNDIKSVLQMGPDNKIYASKNGRSFLAAIDSPNNLGTACGYVDNAVDLQGRTGRLGLPNFLPGLFEEALQITGPDSICVNSTSISFAANKKTCHTFGYQWWVTGNASIQSTLDSLVVLDFGATGQAVLYVERYDLCDTLLDSLVITISCNASVCNSTIPLLELGPDTSFCENGITILNASNRFDQYRWNTLSTDSTISATDPGLYWVEVTTTCGDTLRDSVYITIDSIIPHLLSDTLICLYDTVQYNLATNYDYQWLPNQFTNCNTCANPKFYPSTSTSYTLISSSNSGCVSVDSFTILVDTCFVVSNLSASACLGNYYSYNGSLIAPNGIDTFVYTSSNGYDSLVILQVSALDTFNIALDTTIQANASYNGQFYTNDTTLLYNQQTIDGCDSIIVINIHVISNNGGQFLGIPDAFSPNGDGVNDDFKPIGLDESDIIEFKVFNRWSQMIYDDSEINNGGWNGTFKGLAQPQEVYIYLLRYQIPGQSEVMLKGQVRLLR